MRVLQVVPRITPQAGGPSVALPGLARTLARHGVDVTMVTTAPAERAAGAPLRDPLVRDGVTYVFHDVWDISGRYGVSPSLVATLRRSMDRFDLVHIHWLYDFACIAAARVALAARVPFVVQPSGSLDPHLLQKNRWIKRAYLATAGRPLLTRAEAVVFTTEQERTLAEYGPRRPEWVVPVGLDASTFTPLPRAGTFRASHAAINGPFLLFVGRLSRQKGLDLLIAAFARVARARQELWLVLAGPDPDGYGARLRTLAEQLGVQHRVIFAGLLPHETKLAAYVDAELFVLPSYAENFGAVVTEALACGLPVVISNQVNIHREMAAAGVATVVECSVESVAAGIEAVLTDPGARRRIATLGPALVRDHYTWDAIVPMLKEKYRELLQATQRARRIERAAHGDELHG